jgi:hypothetical protein
MAEDQDTRTGYEVAASHRQMFGKMIPTLKVVRRSDKRVIYPFEGCEDMPFFPDAQGAREFAQTYGWRLVDGDIAVPE